MEFYKEGESYNILYKDGPILHLSLKPNTAPLLNETKNQFFIYSQRMTIESINQYNKSEEQGYQYILLYLMHTVIPEGSYILRILWFERVELEFVFQIFAELLRQCGLAKDLKLVSEDGKIQINWNEKIIYELINKI
ncbi:hypothetical protein TCON_0802 [Astathelohania contejeani]|uniref:Uncharacterized protein n=1 Tax=Astathelohania contejeani TaxID=164912 RepID=A0ABQ7I0Q5_9MICR|nr:hypothetical protein TCON_0802 [Thelohania contejeani]